jgi:hypothetical protein
MGFMTQGNALIKGFSSKNKNVRSTSRAAYYLLAFILIFRSLVEFIPAVVEHNVYKALFFGCVLIVILFGVFTMLSKRK